MSVELVVDRKDQPIRKNPLDEVPIRCQCLKCKHAFMIKLGDANKKISCPECDFALR